MKKFATLGELAVPLVEEFSKPAQLDQAASLPMRRRHGRGRLPCAQGESDSQSELMNAIRSAWSAGVKALKF